MTLRWESFLDVLALLGAHLVGRERAELAARLPETMALILLNPLRATEPLSAERFVRATAAWTEGPANRPPSGTSEPSSASSRTRPARNSPGASCFNCLPTTTCSSAGGRGTPDVIHLAARPHRREGLPPR
ncbi:hypothetical protein SCMC78_70190 [Streptomyces sp. CMC78]|uniref:Uncharacterized protein n=1 Tax=Streptomyces sp. CMC78 TaxID=3231512 RepID=A0AB33KRM9_9ACTN